MHSLRDALLGITVFSPVIYVNFNNLVIFNKSCWDLFLIRQKHKYISITTVMTTYIANFLKPST